MKGTVFMLLYLRAPVVVFALTSKRSNGNSNYEKQKELPHQIQVPFKSAVLANDPKQPDHNDIVLHRVVIKVSVQVNQSLNKHRPNE